MGPYATDSQFEDKSIDYEYPSKEQAAEASCVRCVATRPGVTTLGIVTGTTVARNKMVEHIWLHSLLQEPAHGPSLLCRCDSSCGGFGWAGLARVRRSPQASMRSPVFIPQASHIDYTRRAQDVCPRFGDSCAPSTF
jgi:hypothetical protein